MNKTLSLVVLLGGLILILYGINASDSIGSAFSRFFTGAPTDRTVWLLVGGLGLVVAGAAGLPKPPGPISGLLNGAVVTLVVTLIAGGLGYGALAGTAAIVAAVLVVFLLVFFVGSLWRGRKA